MASKSKSIAQIKIGETVYSIRATEHSLQRMAQRNISEYTVTGTVIALGPQVLKELGESNEEAIIIDSNSGCSVVAAVHGQRVFIITVIDKTNVFVKTATRVERI